MAVRRHPKPSPQLEAPSVHLGIPQPTRRLLTEHATEVGVDIRRGCELVGLSQDDDGVSVELADGTQPALALPRRVRRRPQHGAQAARCRLPRRAAPGSRRCWARWRPPRIRRRLPPSSRRSARPAAVRPRTARDGVYRVVVPADGVADDRTVPPTLEEFKQQLRAVAGTDFGVHSTALALPLRRLHPARRGLPDGPGAARRRRGAHPPAGGRAGAQPRSPGRVQPRLEAGRPDRRLGAGRAAGQLPRREAPGRRRRTATTPARRWS